LAARFQSLRGATFQDVLSCASAVADSTDSVDRCTADAQHDVAALQRYVAHVVGHFDVESPQYLGLHRGLDDVADEYRAALATLVRLAVSQLSHVDASRRRTLLTVTGSRGQAAQAPNPFVFQRQHARAIQVRLARNRVVCRRVPW
jgi:hypothetical protein